MESANDAPVGVLLFNLGGPGSLADIQPFLVELFSDREIIQLPFGAVLQPLFARLIARARGPAVRRNYEAIGGGSPQLRITGAQASALEARLNQMPLSAGRVRVYVAMRYLRPSIDDALAEMAAAGARRIVTLTLFPHWSRATTGSWHKAFQTALGNPRWAQRRFAVSHIDRYPDDPGYLDALTGRVREALAAFPPASRDRAVILFSAHGLPKKMVDAGDPYVEDIERTRQGLVERLRLPNPVLLGYQSRSGPVRWIGPDTAALVRELGAKGVKDLLVVPISFVSDHIETLYEIDILFAGIAREAGIEHYRRADTLNLDPGFVDALARLVARHLEEDAAGGAS